MVELPLRHPELFQRLGVDPPKGVLLHGPPGTGKTRLARAVANESEAKFFHIAGPEVMGSAYGESEKKLRELFEEAAKSAPSIIFIDEIDSIAPKRGQVSGEAEKRLVAQLLTLMDGIEPRQNLVVIAATNRPEAIDEALRRPGRFDREIVIGVPDENGRREILGIHTRGMPLADGRRPRRARAAHLRLRRRRPCRADPRGGARGGAADHAQDQPRRSDDPDRDPRRACRSTRADFENALKRVQPSAMREVMVAGARRDVGRCRRARRRARPAARGRRTAAEASRRVPPARHPPGQGLPALWPAGHRQDDARQGRGAREPRPISSPPSRATCCRKWYGESEQQIARLFARARQVAPTVIFIDELDSLVPARGGGMGEPQVTERVVNTILAEMDGLEELNNVVLIGATNRPNLIDPALLRPGRFDELIFVGVPDAAGRRRILAIHTERDAAGQGRRPRIARAAHRALHRRRPRGSRRAAPA